MRLVEIRNSDGDDVLINIEQVVQVQATGVKKEYIELWLTSGRYLVLEMTYPEFKKLCKAFEC